MKKHPQGEKPCFFILSEKNHENMHKLYIACAGTPFPTNLREGWGFLAPSKSEFN
jgi:hypothetical protein